MKKLIALMLALSTVAVFSCNKDDDDDPTPTSNNNNNSNNNNTVERPASYIVIEGDSFFATMNRQNPAQNAFRYQFNFSSVDQLDQTNNDGQTESTIGMVLTMAEKPSSSIQAPLTTNRFIKAGEDSANLYFSFFINTGHPEEGKNYLSPRGDVLDVVISNGDLTTDLPAMTLIDEGDNSRTLDLSAGHLEVSGW
ncbi:hypothetical protein [Salibacter halophilus]|uniref:Uncharacterized protein n=1 Tax=Salibacter halophilus TaxID=1803916 RepID=A0A6N6MBU6_9FLAO|nr:hypothetical protein [Salibacter halophilus]KAB1064804.1 hypothetical protein F3059_05460 [Salibacter halophilus]